ncbi:hypothetical protein TRVA0_006S00122 [Trichomonascus vanleenenianus]|uniref:uncharacterized protein n=1 Tax=Trichomonascus vanleenenianus TaxID=2268995 RepID=UPI003ECAFF2D
MGSIEGSMRLPFLTTSSDIQLVRLPLQCVTDGAVLLPMSRYDLEGKVLQYILVQDDLYFRALSGNFAGAAPSLDPEFFRAMLACTPAQVKYERTGLDPSDTCGSILTAQPCSLRNSPLFIVTRRTRRTIRS